MDIQERIIKQSTASDVLFNLKTAGFWVRDKNFVWYNISQKASDILYWLDSDACIWRTDLELAENNTHIHNPDMYCKVCRTSDKYVLDNPENNKYFNYTFIELIEWADGKKHMWKTTKGIHPRDINTLEYYHYWMALFMDEMLGSYENALERLKQERENKNLKQINQWLYVYKN